MGFFVPLYVQILLISGKLIFAVKFSREFSHIFKNLGDFPSKLRESPIYNDFENKYPLTLRNEFFLLSRSLDMSTSMLRGFCIHSTRDY